MKSHSSKSSAADKGTSGEAGKRRSPTKKQEKAHEEEILDEGIEDSFPASDPPSTSVPGTGIARP